MSEKLGEGDFLSQTVRNERSGAEPASFDRE